MDAMKALRRLLFAGCGEKGVAKPIRSRLLRLLNRFLNFFEVIRAEPHPDKFAQCLALGLLWSANLPSHAKNSVLRKLFLHQDISCGTNIQVLNGTALSLEEMAGTAAGESELTNSLPVSAGASQRESEMSAETIQAGNPDRQARSLKIEATGDFLRQKITPKIRLTGKWLERAGFKPGHRVQILIEQPGTLSLRFVEQSKEVAL